MSLHRHFTPGENTTRRAVNDNRPSMRPLTGRNLRDDILMGLRLYSRLPTGDRPHEQPELARIAPALPLTSVLIGIFPAILMLFAVAIRLPDFVAAALGVALLVLITGGMAEDALADAADGLFGGTTPERRLEIMKDPRHGTFGIAALCLFLILRVLVLGALLNPYPLEAAAIWIAALVLSRSGALWLARALPPARSSGLSAAAGGLSRMQFVFGMALAAVIAFVFAAPASGLIPLLLAVLFGAGLACGWTKLCSEKVGGQTGDLIGALQALLEISLLLVFLIFV